MKTEVERLEEKNTVLLKVEVPADEFGKAIDQAYKKIAGQVTIPGFRKGKVPKSIIDSRIGKDAVREEAVQNALPTYYIDALKGSEVEPVDQPEVDLVQVEEGQPLVFTAKVKVKPEIKLGEYKGIELHKPSTEPTEEEIKTQVDALRDQFATLEPVEGRAVQMGDFALINFEGFIGDEPFEGGSANDYMLEIGSGSFIPGFEDQMVGMQKGEIKDIMVTFPEDYGNAELAGKEARFRVLVKEIKTKKLPEVDDDFSKQVGFDTYEELRTDIADKISGVKKKQAEAALNAELLKKVTDNAELDLHDVMIEYELNDMMEDFAYDVSRQGLNMEQYFQFTGQNPEELKNSWRNRAEDRIKSRLVVEAIAKAENIEVVPEEVDNEVRKAAEASGRSFDDVKRVFEAGGNMDTLKNRILVNKTLDWLLEQSKIIEESPAQEAQESTAAETAEAKSPEGSETSETAATKTPAKPAEETTERENTKTDKKEVTTQKGEGAE